MKFLIFSIVFILGINPAFSEGKMRVIVPSLDSLSGFSPKENEIAYDESDNDLVIFKNGNFKRLIKQEKIPLVTSAVGSPVVSIRPGTVLIDDISYTNNSPITCNILSNYAGTLPANGNVVYLYWIPNTASGYEGQFKCIFSLSENGVSSVSSVWKRYASFKFNYTGFWIKNSVVHYRPVSVRIPLSTTTTCTPVNISTSLSLATDIRVLLAGECYAPTFEWGLYLNSTCTSDQKIFTCNSTGKNLWRNHPVSETLYFKGTVSSGASIEVLQVEGTTSESEASSLTRN